MNLGEHAYTKGEDALGASLKEMAQRVAKLERVVASGSAVLTQFGRTSGDTNGSGEFTITFPSAFSSQPVVMAQAITTLDRFVVLRSISTTQFTVAYYAIGTGSLVASGDLTVNWTASA